MPTNKRTATTPTPMAGKGQPVDWMFAFKYNAAFPGAGTEEANLPQQGIFGGTLRRYPEDLQYSFATSTKPSLQRGVGALGTSLRDPLGATFDQIYNNPDCFFVLWNDQFYSSPIPTQLGPWGHSKGALAWDAQGNGMVLQVSTPCWPGSGTSAHPRESATYTVEEDGITKQKTTDGNTLGYILGDDDIEVSQHFFALKLDAAGVTSVLKALATACVVTDTTGKHPQIVRNGGPAEIAALVSALGQEPGHNTSKATFAAGLTGNVRVIAKPHALHVPPWQMISSLLGGVALRVASWWEEPAIPSTTNRKLPGCWDPSLTTPPGPVQIAITGQGGIGLTGHPGKNYNHAKLGVTVGEPTKRLAIFGDMNQMGAFRASDGGDEGCSVSQNGRGGLFFVVDDAALWTSITALIAGASAPRTVPTATGVAKKAAKKVIGTRVKTAGRLGKKVPATKVRVAVRKTAAKKAIGKSVKRATRRSPAPKK